MKRVKYLGEDGREFGEVFVEYHWQPKVGDELDVREDFNSPRCEEIEVKEAEGDNLNA